jgi:light-regulated signal transduction histidine kinase (bacteriophytochrome)
VGFGDLLPDGHLFAVVMFSKIPISRETAALFSHLSLSVKMALLPFVKCANAFESELLDLRRLLQNYEEIVAQQEYRFHAILEDLSRSNADLEQFAHSVSHDLQEPLRAVSGFCQLLKKRYRDQLDMTAQQFIDDAVDGARRMQQIIKDLLAYSRVGRLSNPAEPVDCGATVGQAVKALRIQVDQSQAKIHYGGLPTVLGYAGPLLELFQNLIGNALKYRGDDSPEVHVTAEASGDQWRFCVRDNGIGIESKDAERIFVVFQRLHTREAYPGTGIGLAICKRIVERHGGSIWLESKLNEGCAFFFTIPRKKGR